MEDYEKKYKKALATAKDLLHIKNTTNYGLDIDLLNYIFPELKNEDEKIRKALVRFHKSTIDIDGIKGTDILAWLEKQGKKYPSIIWHSISEEPEEMKELFCEWETNDATWHDVAFYDEESKTFRHAKMPINVTKWVYVDELLEKQGEQKPSNVDYYQVDDEVGNLNDWVITTSHDKVEPKFKNGQWIVWQDKCYKVNYNGCGYELVDQNGLSTSLEYGTVDENAHLWDITKDAKDGDILCWDESKCIALFKNIDDKESFNSYGFVGHCTGTFESRLAYHDIEGAHPATKEQRDTLMKAMADAGYEWNAEKKELKKIEQKSANSVKTEFKVGDWIVGTLGGYYKVLAIEQEYNTGKYDYILLEPSGNETSYGKEFVDEHFHRWTIQDAKDGDVLVDEDNNIGIYQEKDDLRWHSYNYLGCDNCLRCVGGYHKHKNTKPATNKQRELFFSKMKEDGYEFDFEKKELKKIEDEIEIPFGAKDSELIEERYYIPKGFHAEIEDDKVVIKKGEKSAAWSDEDEENLQHCCMAISADSLHTYEDKQDMEAWLKRLKDRIGG